MKRDLLIKGVGIAATRAIGAVLGMAVTVVIGRTLGPDGLGVFAYAVVGLTILTIPISYGWGVMLLRTVSAASHSGTWAEVRGMARRGTQYGAAIPAALVLPVLAVMAVAPDSFPESYGLPVLAMLALVLGFDHLSALRTAVLRGLDAQVLAQLPEMAIRPALLVCGFVVLVWLSGTPRLEHAFMALLGASVLSALAGAAILRRKAPQALREAAPEHEDALWLKSAAAFATSSGLVVVNSFLDIIILGLFADAADVGNYRVAAQVAVLSGLAYTALNMVATQRFAYFRASGDAAGAQRMASFLSLVAVVAALPVPLVLLAAGEPIIAGVFGAEFGAALGPMLILCAAQAISAGFGMAQSLLTMNGHEAKVARMTAGMLAANVVACLALVPVLGTIGAALANLLVVTGWNLAMWRMARRLTGINASFAALALAKSRPAGGGGA